MAPVFGEADLERAPAARERAHDVDGGVRRARHAGHLAEGEHGAGGTPVVGAGLAGDIAQAREAALQRADRGAPAAREHAAWQDVDGRRARSEAAELRRRVVRGADAERARRERRVGEREDAGPVRAGAQRTRLRAALAPALVEADDHRLAGDEGRRRPAHDDARAGQRRRACAADALELQRELGLDRRRDAGCREPPVSSGDLGSGRRRRERGQQQDHRGDGAAHRGHYARPGMRREPLRAAQAGSGAGAPPGGTRRRSPIARASRRAHASEAIVEPIIIATIAAAP